METKGRYVCGSCGEDYNYHDELYHYDINGFEVCGSFESRSRNSPDYLVKSLCEECNEKENS